MAGAEFQLESQKHTDSNEQTNASLSRLLDEGRRESFHLAAGNKDTNGKHDHTKPHLSVEEEHRRQTTAAPEKLSKISDATLGPIDKAKVKEVKWTSSHDLIEIAPGVKFQSWNFGGKVPGPVLAVNQGDIVKFELNNGSDMPHSIDFHSARTAPNKNYKDIWPGEKHSFTWKAEDPGAFMYHCGTPSALHHMAMGMYGAVIVKPKDLPKADKEFVLVQSEFYTSKPDKSGVRDVDIDKAFDARPDYVTFNGYADKYKDQPLEVKVGDKVRMWVVNAGPGHNSAFHVVGTIFDAAYPDGNPKNKLTGMQTINIPPGGGAMVEFTLKEEGDYPFVTHSFGDASKGAVGIIRATKR